MKFKDYVNEAIQRLGRSNITKINKDLQKVMKKTYFKAIPLKEISDVLKKYNVILLQEDGTEWDGFLIGGVDKTEQVYFDLGWMDKVDTKTGVVRYERIPDSMLALSYYKMPSGKYEVIAYLT